MLLAVNYRVTVRTPGSDVEAWSSIRLPFEPKGWLLDFRRELAQACRELTAAPRQVLHAVYTSADHRLVDVENVLTYNLGTAAIRAAAQHGLILERSYCAVHDGDHQHHYRYRFAEAGQRWSHWSAGELLGSIGFAAPAEAFRAPTAGRWWLAARRAGFTAHAQTTTVPDRLALRVSVSPPERWRGSLASLVKPLTDGLIAAMHAHEGPVDPVLGPAPTIDPDLTRDEFRALLLEPTRAPLGRVRLVVPWGTTLQWLPADDRIVALDIRLTTDRDPGTVTAEALMATSR
jgi:hypothetical protein